MFIVRWMALLDDVMQRRCGIFGNSDSPQRRLSSRLEPPSHEFRLAVKLGVVSGYVLDSKHVTRHICKSLKCQPMVNLRYI